MSTNAFLIGLVYEIVNNSNPESTKKSCTLRKKNFAKSASQSGSQCASI